MNFEQEGIRIADTLQIRCERERHGVLIGDSCFRKDAVIWPESEAPR